MSETRACSFRIRGRVNLTAFGSEGNVMRRWWLVAGLFTRVPGARADDPAWIARAKGGMVAADSPEASQLGADVPPVPCDDLRLFVIAAVIRLNGHAIAVGKLGRGEVEPPIPRDQVAADLRALFVQLLQRPLVEVLEL